MTTTPKTIISPTRKERLISLKKEKGGACFQCGYNKNYAALHFHHMTPADKSFTLSGTKVKLLQKEADKCVLLCSNCHTELHHPQLTSSLFDYIPNKCLSRKKHPRSPVSSPQRQQVLDMLQRGVLCKEITEECGISRHMINQICMEAGLGKAVEQYGKYLERIIQRFRADIIPQK